MSILHILCNSTCHLHWHCIAYFLVLASNAHELSSSLNQLHGDHKFDILFKNKIIFVRPTVQIFDTQRSGLVPIRTVYYFLCW